MKGRSESLPYEARIGGKQELERVRREGVWKRGRLVDLIFASSETGRSRLGLVVPSYSHGSVERNKLKRRLREISRRRILPDMKEATDLVVRAKEEAYLAKFSELEREMLDLSEGFIDEGD